MKFTLIYVTLLSLVLFTHCQDLEEGNVYLSIPENGDFVDIDWEDYLNNIGLTQEDISNYSACLYDSSCGIEYSMLGNDGCAYVRDYNGVSNAMEVWSICYSADDELVVNLQVLDQNNNFVTVDWTSYLQSLGLTEDEISGDSSCLYDVTCGNAYTYLDNNGCGYIRYQNTLNSVWEVWAIC